jgi:hypothetical protein
LMEMDPLLPKVGASRQEAVALWIKLVQSGGMNEALNNASSSLAAHRSSGRAACEQGCSWEVACWTKLAGAP